MSDHKLKFIAESSLKPNVLQRIIDKKNFELEFYTLLILAFTVLDKSLSVMASLLILLVLMNRLRTVNQQLFAQPLLAMQKSHVGITQFEQLKVWHDTGDYQSHYALSEVIAKALFDALGQKLNMTFSDLAQMIDDQTGHFQNFPKPIQTYLQKNPLMWQAGFEKSKACDTKLYLPLTEIEEFARLLPQYSFTSTHTVTLNNKQMEKIGQA